MTTSYRPRHVPGGLKSRGACSVVQSAGNPNISGGVPFCSSSSCSTASREAFTKSSSSCRTIATSQKLRRIGIDVKKRGYVCERAQAYVVDTGGQRDANIERHMLAQNKTTHAQAPSTAAHHKQRKARLEPWARHEQQNGFTQGHDCRGVLFTCLFLFHGVSGLRRRSSKEAHSTQKRRTTAPSTDSDKN